MTRKDMISMDYQVQIYELHQRGHSIRKIAETLKMCRRSVRKYIEKQELIKLKKEVLNQKEVLNIMPPENCTL